MHTRVLYDIITILEGRGVLYLALQSVFKWLMLFQLIKTWKQFEAIGTAQGFSVLVFGGHVTFELCHEGKRGRTLETFVWLAIHVTLW